MSTGILSFLETSKENPFLFFLQLLEAILILWHMAIPPSSTSAVLQPSDNYSSYIYLPYTILFRALAITLRPIQIIQDNLTMLKTFILYTKSLLPYKGTYSEITENRIQTTMGNHYSVDIAGQPREQIITAQSM